MGNGTKIVTSGRVTALYKRIVKTGPLYRHYTIKQKYMVAVVGEPLQIMIYDFARSVKPLMRVVDAGERVLLRDFWNLDEGIVILQHLDRICANQRKQAGEHLSQGVCAEEFKETKPGSRVGILLNPQGQVVLSSPLSMRNQLPLEAE